MKKSSFTRINRKVGFAQNTKTDGPSGSEESDGGNNSNAGIASPVVQLDERKKDESNQRLPGTRVSLYGGKDLISCGHAFIDNSWGGGAGIGQLLVIQEDSNSCYYKILLSLFIAQSLSLPQPQSSLIVTHNVNSLFPLPKPLHQKLSNNPNAPSELSDPTEKEDIENIDQPLLKIAWRYENNLKEKESSKIAFSKSSYCDVFDLHKTMELSADLESNIHKIDIQKLKYEVSSDSQFLSSLYSQIKSLVEKYTQEKKVLRIVIESFGSSFWREGISENELIRFIILLKMLIRQSTAVCMISLPVRVLSDYFTKKVQYHSDLVSAFESFKGESDAEVGEAFKDYNGHFNVLKLPKIHTLTAYSPETLSYVFSRKRHKFLVEVFSLPPELSRTTEQPKAAKPVNLCQPGPGNTNSIIDF